MDNKEDGVGTPRVFQTGASIPPRTLPLALQSLGLPYASAPTQCWAHKGSPGPGW